MKDIMVFLRERKSIRTFNDCPVNEAELNALNEFLAKLKVLFTDVPYEIVITKREPSMAKFGEFSLLLYTNRTKEGLLNAGFIFASIEHYLMDKHIGVCYYGLGHPNGKYSVNKLRYCMMLVFGHCDEELFLPKMKTRKDLSLIWEGDFNRRFVELISLVPSACNSQPWLVKSEENNLVIYKRNESNRIPKNLRDYYNSIDMGIFIYYMNALLTHFEYQYLFSYDLASISDDLERIGYYKLEEK